jgi:hypothetical protein
MSPVHPELRTGAARLVCRSRANFGSRRTLFDHLVGKRKHHWGTAEQSGEPPVCAQIIVAAAQIYRQQRRLGLYNDCCPCKPAAARERWQQHLSPGGHVGSTGGSFADSSSNPPYPGSSHLADLWGSSLLKE